MKFAAVIFDMDGTMLDTEQTYRIIYNRAAADCDIEIPPALHEILLGRNSVDTKAILGEHCGSAELFDRLIDRARHHHAICFATPPPLKPGLLDLLDLLETHRIPKTVATSTPRKSAIPRLTE